MARFLPFIPLLAVQAQLPDEDTRSLVNTGIEVLGTTYGSFQTFNKTLGSRDPNRVEVSLVSLSEVNASGEELLSKHSVQQLAKQDFQYPRVPDIVNLAANGTSDVNSTLIRMHMLVPDLYGEVELQAYSMLNGGKVGPEGHSWEASRRDVKWAVRLQNWLWCGGCQFDVCDCGAGFQGGFIDVQISVKGLMARENQEMAIDVETMALGANVVMQLNRWLILDGVQEAMPTGYPKLQGDPGSQVLVVRFPKFTYDAIWDPLIRMSLQETGFVALDWEEWVILLSFPVGSLLGVIFMVRVLRPKKINNRLARGMKKGGVEMTVATKDGKTLLM